MLKVFNLRNLLKYIRFVIYLIILLLTFILLKNFSSIFRNSNFNIDFFSFSCINQLIPGISESYESATLSFPTNISYSDLSLIDSAFILPAESINANLDSLENNTVSNDLTLAQTNVDTEILSSNVPNTFTNSFQDVQIKNGTSYELTNEILDYSSLKINTSDVILFHTHTCESYTPSEQFSYEASGNFRTLNLERSVAKVGSELSNYLINYGFNVIHDVTYHDYPAYNGSYGRSMSTVESVLNSKPNTDIIIDLHRDAIGDSTYAPSVKIGDDIVSRLMFVIGTDGGGLSHPNWQNNLKFAIKIQSKANELYPGLFKPITLSTSRYNQHLGNAACIIEVGATGNTLEQSTLSMKYLSKVFDAVLKSNN